MKSISVFCLICIFLCVNSFLKAGTTSWEDSVFVTANQHYQQSNYLEAAIAFERLYFFSDNTQWRLKANLGRAGALKQNHQYARAARDLQRSAHLHNHPRLHAQVIYEMAFCNYMAGNYSAALSSLQQLGHYYDARSEDGDVIRLFALAAIMAEEWELAQDKTLELIEKGELGVEKSDSLIQKTLFLFCHCTIPAEKSESRATTISAFIPGAGQWYAGYPVKGLINSGSQLTALGLTALMGYHQLYISGFVIGLGMFQSFYFGGIRQAGHLAQQANTINMTSHKQRLKDFVMSIDGLP